MTVYIVVSGGSLLAVYARESDAAEHVRSLKDHYPNVTYWSAGVRPGKEQTL